MIINTGVISGGVQFLAGDNMVENLGGRITGPLEDGDGIVTVINAGEILGDISLGNLADL